MMTGNTAEYGPAPVGFYLLLAPLTIWIDPKLDFLWGIPEVKV